MSDKQEKAGVLGTLATMALHHGEEWEQIHDTVAALIETAHRAEVMFNTVRGCYERNPGNFMFAMRELEADVIPLREALRRAQGKQP